MSELTIERATADDREWAAGLMARSDPWVTLGRTIDHCRRALVDADAQVFVARLDGRPRGFLILQPRGAVGAPYLRSIGVDEGLRGRGIGTALLRFTEEYFRRSSTHLFLCVSSFNPRARALYERCGYRQVGELPDFIVEGASEILMYKRLDGRRERGVRRAGL